MAKAKEDHSERVNKATAIKADIAKTLDAVIDANNVLQVINITIITTTDHLSSSNPIRSSLMTTPKFS